MTEPLTLPENYNPDTYLLSKTTENGLFHESRAGARLAEELVANGAPQDIELAHRVLDATLNCQETALDDPHRGNFYWMAEDDVVGDLNAVEFNLEKLIPMMLHHADRLSDAMQQRVLAAIELGLEEIQRIDVAVMYSNITALDVVNTCLGGELLGNAAIARRGYDKLIKWMLFTDQNGIPTECNSPTYTSVVIRALKRLTDNVQHESTRIRARTLAARMALSTGLHIHRKTGRWAGPHSRAYQPSVVAETPPEIELVNAWIEEGALPHWTADLLQYPAEPFQITETALAKVQGVITTYQSASFALGISSREYSGQSNVMMAHIHREGADRPGVLYTRYLTGDKWLGDFYHATDRTKSRNLIEEGLFFGTQSGARAIGLYTPKDIGTTTSAKAAFIITQRQYVDEIWLGEDQVDSLPVDVAEGKTIVIGTGDALIGIRPLSRTDLGRSAPIRIVERQGDLVLEIYNYLGSQKPFWEMWPQGPFFKGFPQCGVYLELAERSAYDDGQAFVQTIDSGTLIDEADAPFVFDGTTDRNWTVAYSRDDETLGIQIELMHWELKRRWTQDGDLGFPMLKSPMALQNRGGDITIGDATLTCGEEAAWLWANPDGKRYVVGYHGPTPAPLKLTVPGGSVAVEAMGTGTLVWDDGSVTVEALDITEMPKVEGGQLM